DVVAEQREAAVAGRAGVDDRGHAAAHAGHVGIERVGAEALEAVHVGVDEAGRDQQARYVQHLAAGRVEVGADGVDATVAHTHLERRVEPLGGVEDTTTAQEQYWAGHGDLQRRFRAADCSHRGGNVANLCRHGSGGAAGTAGAYGNPTTRP